MSSSRPIDESIQNFSSSFPEFVGYSFTTLLMWIFALAVFVPLSSLVLGHPSITPIITLIFFSAIAYSAVRLLYTGKRALDSYVEISAARQSGIPRRLSSNSAKLVGYIGLAVLGGIIFAPITWMINPVFGGITIVLVILTVVFLALPLVSGVLSGSRRNSPQDVSRQ